MRAGEVWGPACECCRPLTGVRPCHSCRDLSPQLLCALDGFPPSTPVSHFCAAIGDSGDLSAFLAKLAGLPISHFYIIIIVSIITVGTNIVGLTIVSTVGPGVVTASGRELLSGSGVI